MEKPSTKEGRGKATGELARVGIRFCRAKRLVRAEERPKGSKSPNRGEPALAKSPRQRDRVKNVQNLGLRNKDDQKNSREKEEEKARQERERCSLGFGGGTP